MCEARGVAWRWRVFFARVALGLDDFEAIARRGREVFELNWQCREMNNFREVEGQFDVVVCEGFVLFGCRISSDAAFGAAPQPVLSSRFRPRAPPGFWHLGLAQGVMILPGRHPRVGAAMSTELGFVAHTTEGDAEKPGPARGVGDGLPREVFPTPGGPARQRIVARVEPVSCSTAMCSRMRRLTSSRPWWSASRRWATAWRSSLASARRCHGSSARRVGMSF